MEYYNNYYEGVFWVSGNEECKIIATLYIDDKGDATISSLQSLTKDLNKDNIHSDWDKIEVAFGFINSHNISKTYSIKLYDLRKIHESNGALSKYKYKSSNSFIASVYDEDICSLSYNTIMLSSDIINSWIPITGFDFRPPDSESFNVNQLYKQPKRIDLFKNDDFYIYIYFRASSGFHVRRRTFINEEVFINIETTTSFEIKELYRVKDIIERFLNILLFIPFYSTKSEFKTVSKTTYIALRKNKELNLGISNKIDFEKFKINSQHILSEWLTKQNKLELAIKNFFSVFGQKGVLAENKFLTYISVLENYHKNNIEKNKTLKERLFYLLNNSSISSELCDIDSYSEQLKTTRNYHAHLEEKHESKALKIEGIRNANVILEFVIRELLLKEIGISEKINVPYLIEKAISNL